MGVEYLYLPEDLIVRHHTLYQTLTKSSLTSNLISQDLMFRHMQTRWGNTVWTHTLFKDKLSSVLDNERRDFFGQLRVCRMLHYVMP